MSNISGKISNIKNIWQKHGIQGIVNKILSRIGKAKDYQKFIYKHRLTRKDIVDASKNIEKWPTKPKFSVIVPVYNVDAEWLDKAIRSVINQIYQEWELCVADDASPKPHVRSILEHYSKLDSRIKVIFRTKNGNISAASNSALDLATGDYIVLLDHDDELTIDALFENAKLINQHPDADFIYSDEDKIDIKGKRQDPFFKPDWSPEYFYSCMYTCHLGVYRTNLLREIGGFRSEYDGSQDYDLVLRVIEKTKNIYHIPKILYHWRTIPSSAASKPEAKPWAYVAGRKALEAMLERSPYPGHVEQMANAGNYRVRRDIIGEPLVSIIIFSNAKKVDSSECFSTRLVNCIHSIHQLSTYRNFEIVVLGGYGIGEEILETSKSPKLQVVSCIDDHQLNVSRKINTGVAKAKGKFLLLINDNVEVTAPDWIESMLELAQQQEIGAVGAKLVSPHGKIQHTGMIFLKGKPAPAFYGFDSTYPGYHNSNLVNKNYLAVTGACLMIRQELYQQLGGLDEAFVCKYADIDLCLKAHEAGYRNLVTPYAELIYHLYNDSDAEENLEAAELHNLNKKWKHYLNGLDTDPYYNPNLSANSPNFELF